MVKYCIDVQRKMYNSMRQSIVNYFNAGSVQQVEMVLAQVRAEAGAEAGTGIRSTVLQDVGFKCKSVTPKPGSTPRTTPAKSAPS